MKFERSDLVKAAGALVFWALAGVLVVVTAVYFYGCGSSQPSSPQWVGCIEFVNLCDHDCPATQSVSRASSSEEGSDEEECSCPDPVRTYWENNVGPWDLRASD